MRLLFITDFTEQFAYRLLRGILKYAKETEPWFVMKMHPSFKDSLGMKGLVKWAVKWKADVVIGQFDPDDDVTLFRRRGIVALAQDYIKTFDSIPNITANYNGTGAMAARFFVTRGFPNFGFVGYGGVCWSDDRCKGFSEEVKRSGFNTVHVFDRLKISDYRDDQSDDLARWLETLPRPIAIMCCDDNVANLLLEHCKICGIKVPSDISVIGVDNDEILCDMSDPALSSINVDIERGGYEAAELAARMVREKKFEGEDIVLQPTNVVPRASSNIFATSDHAVLSALQFIGENARRRISVKDVLEVVPMSRRLLEQRFLKETGSTIYQYITMVRMNIFARLLIETKDSISEIAAKLDEPDTKSISRRFLAVKGCTPSDFRKQKTAK